MRGGEAPAAAGDPLWGCLLLPELALEVFTRAQVEEAAAAPFAVSSGGHYPRIVIANAAALERGLQCGQLVSAAYALAPEVVLRERDDAGEHAALEGVAAWLTQFTPMVSLAPPHAVLIEVGGSVRLFGGLSALMQRIEHGVRELGFSVRAAWAPTPGAAMLLARAGRVRPVQQRDDPERALADIALVHLESEDNAEAIALLASAGVRTFGAACALPRAALARRVGAAFVATLDRVCARAADPRVPYVAPARYRGRLDLPAPVGDVEALGFAVNRLVHELAGWLLGRGLGVSELGLTLAHERYVGVRTGVPATCVRFALAAPAREPAHLMGVLRERLARVVLPAPVERIVLASEATAPLAGTNLGLLPGDEVAPGVPLLDRLRARLGEQAVVRVQSRPEHRPERAWSEAAAEQEPSARMASHAKPVRAKRDARKSESASNRAGEVAPRPVWLLGEPQPLGAMLEAQPWILRDGPERIESGWWDGADTRRDYYVAENPRGELV
jgi:protein ImuB